MAAKRQSFESKLMIGDTWIGKRNGTEIVIRQIWRKDKRLYCEWVEDGMCDSMTFQHLRTYFEPRTIYVE